MIIFGELSFFLHFLSHSSLLDRRLSLLDRADVVIFSSSQHIESIFMSSKTILCKIAASSLSLSFSAVHTHTGSASLSARFHSSFLSSTVNFRSALFPLLFTYIFFSSLLAYFTMCELNTALLSADER